MSAHVLWNLSNELWKGDKMGDLLSILSLSQRVLQEHGCKILFITGHKNYLKVAFLA